MPILGLSAKLFRGTAGTTAATEMKNVTDVTLNIETGDADATSRAAEGWRISVATLKEASLDFSMIYSPDDADITAVRTAFLSCSPLAMFVTDGLGSGLDADWVITSFNMEQNLEEVIKISVTAKPTMDERAPAYVTGNAQQ